MADFRISTTRLLIRKLTVEDVIDFYLYRSNPDVTKYQGFDVMTLAEAEVFIKQQKDVDFRELGRWAQYGILDINRNIIIGDCAIKLRAEDGRIGEIGMTISHLEQQKGYAKETLMAILAYLFNDIKLHRVVEVMDAENVAAIKLMESIGFRKEGHFIENVFFKGKWGDECQYAMLRVEWLEKIINSV